MVCLTAGHDKVLATVALAGSFSLAPSKQGKQAMVGLLLADFTGGNTIPLPGQGGKGRIQEMFECIIVKIMYIY